MSVITLEKQGPIVVMTLNRPDARMAMERRLLQLVRRSRLTLKSAAPFSQAPAALFLPAAM